jgi:hypothetical protein
LTLARCICGLLDCTNGRIAFKGVSPPPGLPPYTEADSSNMVPLWKHSRARSTNTRSDNFKLRLVGVRCNLVTQELFRTERSEAAPEFFGCSSNGRFWSKKVENA